MATDAELLAMLDDAMGESGRLNAGRKVIKGTLVRLALVLRILSRQVKTVLTST